MWVAGKKAVEETENYGTFSLAELVEQPTGGCTVICDVGYSYQLVR